MAVLFMDGFDHYSSKSAGGAGGLYTDELERNGWTSASYYFTGTSPSDRYTSYNGRMMNAGSTNASLIKTGLPATVNCVLGFALKEFTLWSTEISNLIGNGTDREIAIYVDSGGYINIYETPFEWQNPLPNGWIATSTQSLTLDRWYYFEIVLSGVSPNQKVQVLVDGEEWVTTGTDLSLSLIQGFTVTTPRNTVLDDLYFVNNSTPLDSPRIITLYPNEEGAQTAWKETWREVEASGGYDLGIDEEYISTDISTNKESWKYNELPPGNWEVHAVGPVIRAKNNGSGTPTITVTCSTGATTPGIIPSNTFTHTKHVENYQTGTTAWTQAAVNGLEITVEYD